MPSLTLSVDATSEPVSLTEAKTHMNITATDDDTYITALIAVATRACQKYQRRQYVNATWVLRLDGFPYEFYVPLPPLSSVTTLAYLDSAGSAQTLTAVTDYQTDIYTCPGRIKPAVTKSWPATQSGAYNTVTLTYVAGYGATASSVPNEIKHAIKEQVAHLYENRDTLPQNAADLPLAPHVQQLLYLDRVFLF